MAYKILVADDEAEIRDVLRLYLEKDGYAVLELSLIHISEPTRRP